MARRGRDADQTASHAGSGAIGVWHGAFGADSDAYDRGMVGMHVVGDFGGAP
jgi:hypothetical protein